ncbi:MAG: radical SAM protein [Selenomonadaceae bacterium]|nr:radical SAM protein [Selenomonadaceae bacterium]
MKNYLKKYRTLDERNLQTVRTNIKLLQNAGVYPQKYNYPITLQFELTAQCNLACKHCYNRSGDRDRETLMTPEKWCELSRQIVADGGIFQCIISGGEPLLLGDKLFDIMDILHDDGTSFIVITNALLLTKEKVKRFAKYRYFWFQISIDGATAEVHNNFRGRKGSFEKAVNGALEISDAGIPLVIAHTVTPQNINDVENMTNLAYQLGANSIILGEVMFSGRAYENAEIVLNEEQKNFLYGQIEELGKKFQGKIVIQRSAELKTQMERYMSEIDGGGIIRPNGDFRLDCMAPFTIGNVLERSIKDMWLEKGVGAWNLPEVKNFIAEIDETTQSSNIKNHVDFDFKL